MKSVKYLLLVVLLSPLGGVQAAQYSPGRDRDAQYGRDRSRQLDNVARDLADKADRLWSLVRDRRDQKNSDVYKALRKFAQNTRNYASRVNEAQNDAYRAGAQQLITEAENISRLVNRTEMTYQLRGDWNPVEDQVGRLGQYYGLPFSPERTLARTDPYYRGDDRYGRDRDRNDRNRDGGYGYQSGTFRWRGRVDGSDVIYVQGNRVSIRHLQSQPISDASYDLPTPLPRTGVNPQLRKLRGRGRVEIAQLPSSSNDYTVGVRIEDPDGGADLYEFELAW